MEYYVEKQREIPVNLECDVLVAGAGIAGMAAAIAAARNGAKVILLEKEYGLGGLATLGLITIYLPLCDGEGHQLVYGLGEELLKLSIKYGAERNYPAAWLDGNDIEKRKANRYTVQYNPNLFAIEAEKMMIDLGIKIMYGTLAVDTVVEDGFVKLVIIENKSGRSAVKVSSVIDCTGDADICRFSGENTAVNSKKNGVASWYYYHNSSGEVNLKMFGLADVIPTGSNQGSLTGNEVVDTIAPRRYSGLDGEDISNLVMDGHQRMLEDIVAARAKDPKLVPVSISSIPLLRMTRRICGAYELDDSQSGEIFEDSIGMTGDWRKRGPAYEIPFRCLHGSKIKNLLAAGRSISVSEPMWEITRVIPPCAVTGEAAGTAAAMGNDFTKLSVPELQKKLLSQNVKLHFDQVMA